MKRKLQALLILFLTYYSVIGQSICFDPEQDNRFETAGSANGIASYDVDNDGWQDVLITCGGCPLSYHRNLGNGSFASAQTLADEGGNQPTLVDIDNDGDLDMVRFYGGSLTVNRNNGSNLFDAGSSYDQIIGNANQIRMELGDLNNDGWIDAVANDYLNDQIFVYWNNGNGTFTISQGIATLDKPVMASIGDTNDDGLNEILVTYAELTTLSIFYQESNNSFSSQNFADYVPFTGVAPLVKMIDYSNDGMADMLISGVAEIIVRVQTSPGVFANPYSIFCGSYAYDWMFGDWNDDGFVEAAIATETSGVVAAFLNNNGNGAQSGSLKYNSSNGPSSKLAHADFDNDGIEDIVVACATAGYFSFLKGHDSARFGSLNLITDANPVEFVSGDIDNDGDIDLINSNSPFSGTLAVHLNNGNGGFANSITMNTTNGTSGILLQDVNGDGNLDLLAAHYNGISVMTGNGNSLFNPAIEFPSVIPTAGGERVICAGDINGDGWLDLAVNRLGTDSIGVSYGTGVAQFNNYQSYAVDGYFKVMKMEDLNEDGFDDLTAAGSDTDELVILFGSASGLSSSPVIKAAAGSPEGLAFMDANEDGHLDIVVSCSNANKINYYQGNGSTVFNDAILFDSPTGSNASDVEVADINSDGHEDIVVALWGQNGAGIYFGDGSGGFSASSTYPTDRRPSDLILADFNEDGAMDIATLNAEVNNISVVLNNAAFISYTGELAFCEGGSVELSVSTPGSYLWSNGETSNSITVSQEGDYSCAITNQSGSCTLVTPAVSVEVFNQVEVSFNINVSLICDTIEPFAITGGVPAGGLYSGSGMSGVFFDPGEVGPGTYEITYTYVDNGNCTNVSITDEIVVELCLGVEEESAPSVFAYPNPTDGLLRFSDRVKNVEIMDLTGRSAWKSSATITECDLSLLSNGFYLVSYIDDDGNHRVQRIEKLKN